MTDQWCSCRVVEPRIFQQGDLLICLHCHEKKVLTPPASLQWAKLKRQALELGRSKYKSMSKDALVSLLLSRDELLFDKWNAPLGTVERQKEMQKEITAHIPYILVKEGGK